jgi:hypothetical protein
MTLAKSQTSMQVPLLQSRIFIQSFFINNWIEILIAQLLTLSFNTPHSKSRWLTKIKIRNKNQSKNHQNVLHFVEKVTTNVNIFSLKPRV